MMKVIDENLPEPSGFRILLKPREIQEKTAGGSILADVSKDHQALQTNVSKVLAMGADCYTENKKNWCKVGDWVLTGKYIGHKFKYDNEEYCIINDDEVIAVVPDQDKVSAK